LRIELYFPAVKQEVYSFAREIGFEWWFVEHYSSYHVDCPNGCSSGSLQGVDRTPNLQVGYGSFDNIPDLADPLVESFLPLQQRFPRSSLQ